jgi:hypothetical protein
MGSAMPRRDDEEPTAYRLSGDESPDKKGASRKNRPATDEEREAEEYAWDLKEEGYSADDAWKKLRKFGASRDLAEEVLGRVYPAKQRARAEDDERDDDFTPKSRARKKRKGMSKAVQYVVLTVLCLPQLGLIALGFLYFWAAYAAVFYGFGLFLMGMASCYQVLKEEKVPSIFDTSPVWMRFTLSPLGLVMVHHFSWAMNRPRKLGVWATLEFFGFGMAIVSGIIGWSVWRGGKTVVDVSPITTRVQLEKALANLDSGDLAIRINAANKLANSKPRPKDREAVLQKLAPLRVHDDPALREAARRAFEVWNDEPWNNEP